MLWLFNSLAAKGMETGADKRAAMWPTRLPGLANHSTAEFTGSKKVLLDWGSRRRSPKQIQGMEQERKGQIQEVS